MMILKHMPLVFVLLLLTVSAHSESLGARNAPGTVAGAVGSYLPLVARSEHSKWAVVKITPSQFSGFATPDGVNFSGSYTIVQTLGAAAVSQSGVYSWPQQNGFAFTAHAPGKPIPGYARWVESTLFEYPQNEQNPQNVSCYFLCILHEEAAGQDKFTDVHLVPDGWREDLLPAVLYLRAHPSLSDLTTSAPDLTQTRALLRNTNPYLVLTAVQLLSARRSLTTADMGIALSSADARVVACSLAIAYFYSWTSMNTHARWLADHVAKIESLDQLEGTAVGTLVASPFNLMLLPDPTTDLPNVDAPIASTLAWQRNSKFEVDLMPMIRQKLNELDPQRGPGDVRWRVINSACQRITGQTNIKFPDLKTTTNVSR